MPSRVHIDKLALEGDGVGRVSSPGPLKGVAAFVPRSDPDVSQTVLDRLRSVVDARPPVRTDGSSGFVIIFIHPVVNLFAVGNLSERMGTNVTLTRPYRGFDAETEFERIATYGHWHLAAAKYEALDGTYRRIEVTDDELRQHFAA